MSGVNQIQLQNKEMLSLMMPEGRMREPAQAPTKEGGKTDVADA